MKRKIIMTTAILLLVAILVAVFALVASVESEIDDLNRGSGSSTNTGTTTPPAGGSDTATPDGSETTTPEEGRENYDEGYEHSTFVYGSRGQYDGENSAGETVSEFLLISDVGITFREMTPGTFTVKSIGSFTPHGGGFMFAYRIWGEDGLEDELHYVDQSDLVVQVGLKDGTWYSGGTGINAGVFASGDNYDTSKIRIGIAEGTSVSFNSIRLYCLVG